MRFQSIAILVAALLALLLPGSAQTQTPPQNVWTYGAIDSCPAEQSVCETWLEFRKRLPTPYQAVSVKKLGLNEWVIVLSEPAPTLASTELDGLVRAVFADNLKSMNRFRWPTGLDGWLEDVVIRVSTDDGQPSLEVLEASSLEAAQLPADLVDKLAFVHRALANGQIAGFAIDDLSLSPVEEAADVLAPIEITSVDVAAWLKDPATVWVPLGGDGAPVAWSKVASSSKPLAFASTSAPIVALALPSKAKLAAVEPEFRKFAVASDLMVGALRASSSKPTIIIARARVASLRDLPPMRFETLQALARNQSLELFQSYERQRIFAGKLDQAAGPNGGWDWAPIGMSPEIEDTDFGTLLNLADQVLKSWSEAGRIQYRGFETYARPDSYPFGNVPASTKFSRQLQTSSLVFNWNTDGWSTLTPADGLGDVLTMRSTGSVQVKYIATNGLTSLPSGALPQSVQDVQRENAEIARSYFASLGDPTLVRVGQYIFLHQVLKNLASLDATGTGEVRSKARTAIVERVLKQEAAGWLRSIESGSAQSRNLQLDDALVAKIRGALANPGADGKPLGAERLADVLTSPTAGVRQSIVLSRQFDELAALEAEQERLYDLYCKAIVAAGGTDVQQGGTRSCGGRFSGEIPRAVRDADAAYVAAYAAAGIPTTSNCPQRLIKAYSDRPDRGSMPCPDLYLMERKDELFKRATAFQETLADLEQIADEISSAAGFSADVARILDASLAAAQQDVTTSSIRTPTVVLSRNVRNSASVGGHNIGGTPVRVQPTGAKDPRVVSFGAKPTIAVPRDQLANANNYASSLQGGTRIPDVAASGTLRPVAQSLNIPLAGPKSSRSLIDVIKPAARGEQAFDVVAVRSAAAECACEILVYGLDNGSYAIARPPKGDIDLVVGRTAVVELLAGPPPPKRIAMQNVHPDHAEAMIMSGELLNAKRTSSKPVTVGDKLLGAARRVFGKQQSPLSRDIVFVRNEGGIQTRLSIQARSGTSPMQVLSSKPNWQKASTTEVPPSEVDQRLVVYNFQRPPSGRDPVMVEVTFAPGGKGSDPGSIAFLAEVPPNSDPKRLLEIVTDENRRLARAKSAVDTALADVRTRVLLELPEAELRMFVKANVGDLLLTEIDPVGDAPPQNILMRGR